MSKAEMTTRERITCMYEHREADRAPIADSPWASTIARWEREGMPPSADWAEYLGADCIRGILPDNNPRFPMQTIEMTGEHRTYTTTWGATRKDWLTTGAQGYLDCTVTDPDAWAKAKERMQPSREKPSMAINSPSTAA